MAPRFLKGRKFLIPTNDILVTRLVERGKGNYGLPPEIEKIKIFSLWTRDDQGVKTPKQRGPRGIDPLS
jgi:hypothetical protein